MSDLRSLHIGVLLFGQSGPFSGPLASTGPEVAMGIRAAFNEANQMGGISDHKLRLLKLDDYYAAPAALNNTRFFIQRDVFSLVGYFGSAVATAVAPIATSYKMPFIGPCVGAIPLRNASLSVINLRASYYDEVSAMVNFVVSAYGYMRISIFFQDDAFGNQGISALQEAMAAIGESILSNGSYSVSDSEVLPGLNFLQSSALPLVPNVIVVWAMGGPAGKFIKLAKTRFPSDVIYVCPSISADGPFMAELGMISDNVFVTQVLPPLEDSVHPFVLRYRSAMNALYPNTIPTAFSLEAYAIGRLIITVLERMNKNVIRSRNSFVETFYTNSIFSLDSLTFGPYVKGTCNQGLRKVWIAQYTGHGFTDVPGYSFDFTGSCLSDPARSLHHPLTFGYVMDADSPVGKAVRDGLYAVANQVNQNGGIFGQAVHFVEMAVRADTQKSTINAFVVHNKFSAVISSSKSLSVASALLETVESQTTLLISPRRLAATRARVAMNPYRLSTGGSPLDEAYAVLRFAQKQLRLQNLVSIVQSGESGTEALVAVKAVSDQLSIDVKSVECQGSSDISRAVNTVVSSSTQAVVVSGTDALIGLVVTIKTRRPDVPVFIVASDFDVALLQASIPDGASNVFMTNFQAPFYTRTDDFSASCRSVLYAMNQSSTPTLANGDGCLIGGLLVETMLFSNKNNLPTLFSGEAVYTSEILTVNGFRLGPYANATCSLRRSNADCECDQGVHTTWLLRLTSNISNPLEVVNDGTLTFDTCGVVLIPAPASANYSGIIIGVIVALVCIFFVTAFVVFRMVRSKHRAREDAIERAPKGNVAIVFTDVQDSTRLWDVCGGMKEALEIHNDVMREMIEKHGGYEVKTQGDSFMVSFSDVDSAVAWSLDVQNELLHVDWPDDILEQESCAVVKSLECEDDGSPIYLFRGLRVRIGIHVGFPELEYNPRTNGVDYFGPIVNGAARIEALGAGGQVLISAEVHSQLCPEAVSHLVFVFLGRFPLKGMVAEQEIVQVSSARLAPRQFPKIDPKKIVTANTQGAQVCEKCNRPLLCTKCTAAPKQRSGSKASTIISRRFSQFSKYSKQHSAIVEIRGRERVPSKSSEI